MFKKLKRARGSVTRPRAWLPVSALLLVAGQANAGAVIKINDEASVSLGAGVRFSFSSVEDGSPSGTERSSDFDVNNVRIFTSGRINKHIGATVNLEGSSDGNDTRILDAYAQFEFNDDFNIWLGRHLPPSDRANLAGPFYTYSWDFPGAVSQYPSFAIGRDDGVTVWGKPLDGKLTYAFGMFEGANRAAGLSNDEDKLLFAGRVAYAFLDPEPAPAYYTASTYYGAKDIFTVGLAFMQQSDAVGTSAAKGDYLAYSLDVLFEKSLAAAGVVTVEGAYYDYDTDNTVDATPAQCATASLSNNCGGKVQGTAYMLGGAYLIPGEVGIGRFQPFVRYQKFEPDSAATTEVMDLGVNYVIKGHDARITGMYSKTEVGAVDTDRFVVGVQLQY